jgi:hypothetical protein
MSFSAPREPVPELATTGTGGGRSARVIAVAVAVVLGVVVYLGVSGRSSPASPSPEPSNLVAVGSRPPRADDFGPGSEGADEVQAIRADPTAPLLYQFLGTSLSMNGRATLAVLDEVAPDRYRGMYRIPYSRVALTADLQFEAITASVSHDDLDRLGVWTLPLDSLRGVGAPPSVVLDMVEPGRAQPLSNPEFNSLATNGFRITVSTTNEDGGGVMAIDVAVNPDRFVPDEGYAIVGGPSGARFTMTLAHPGSSLIGEAEIPAALLGRLLPVSLTAIPMSDPTAGPVTVSTWWIQTPPRAKDNGNLAHIEAHSNPRPISVSEPQVIGNGYDISISQSVQKGRLYLMVVLTIRPINAISPTAS